MRLLLDTHTFLWWVADRPELSARARSALSDDTNQSLLSLASCWEMAIKISVGKLSLETSLERFVPEQLAANGIAPLGIRFRHLSRVASLELHHRDPFDRSLVAQSIEDSLTIVSSDLAFRRYGVPQIW